MTRRNIVGIAALVAGLAVLPGGANAQQKSMKDLLVGAWTLLLDDSIKDDGTHVPSFGPNPDGLLIFTPDGHFSVQIDRSGRKPFASNSRITGTADENKATVQGTLAYFGTYRVDEPAKSITFRVQASTYPNWDSTTQKRIVTALTDEVLTYNNPMLSVPGYTHAELAWKKLK